MSDAPVTVELHPSHFGEARKPIASLGELRVEAFRYPSGVAALGVTNGVGSLILLPFQGQQIWDAEFHGRRLTMLSAFDEPQPTRDYLRTYGAFFIHCGGTSMGNPGPDDDHPLHGELPNLPYDGAQLAFGEDETGAYVELTGTARDTLAFHHDFTVRPRLRLREGATAFEASVEVVNRAGKPMPFLYLAHVNFRPADGGVLVDTVRDDRADIAVRPAVPEAQESEAVRAYHRAVAQDPSSHRRLAAGVPATHHNHIIAIGHFPAVPNETREHGVWTTSCFISLVWNRRNTCPSGGPLSRKLVVSFHVKQISGWKRTSLGPRQAQE